MKKSNSGQCLKARQAARWSVSGSHAGGATLPSSAKSPQLPFSWKNRNRKGRRCHVLPSGGVVVHPATGSAGEGRGDFTPLLTQGRSVYVHYHHRKAVSWHRWFHVTADYHSWPSTFKYSTPESLSEERLAGTPPPPKNLAKE